MNEHSKRKNDWIDNEYQRLKLIQISKENEIVLINGDKEIKRKDLTQFFTNEEINNLIVEETVIPFNVGKEFHEDWNRKDIWSGL